MGIISHMLVLATPSSRVHNTNYLDPYHRNVASDTDRHFDITFGLQLVESSPEAFNHPYISFFHLLGNGFSVDCVRTFLADPLPYFNWWAVSMSGDEFKWRQHNLLHFYFKCHPIHPGILKDPSIGAQTYCCIRYSNGCPGIRMSLQLFSFRVSNV